VGVGEYQSPDHNINRVCNPVAERQFETDAAAEVYMCQLAVCRQSEEGTNLDLSIVYM
jgi:hypothetical protein